MSKIRIAFIDNLTGGNAAHTERQVRLLEQRLAEKGMNASEYEIVQINADVNGDGDVKPDELRYRFDQLSGQDYDYVSVSVGFEDSSFNNGAHRDALLNSIARVDDNDTEIWVPSGNLGHVNEVAKAQGVTVVGSNVTDSDYTPTHHYASTAEKIITENPVYDSRNKGTSYALPKALGTKILQDTGRLSSVTPPKTDASLSSETRFASYNQPKPSTAESVSPTVTSSRNTFLDWIASLFN